MYSLKSYEAMIDDGVRMNAYAAALRAVISPTSVVVDIGAGTGVMSMLACQFGAKRVYAIEPDDAVEVARQNIVANGMDDRITCIQGLSTKVGIPEKADVIVADLRGVLPLFPGNINSMIHARGHLLAPGGVMIPHLDRLWMAVVTGPSPTGPEKTWRREELGLNLSAARQYLANTPRKQYHSTDELLTPPMCCGELDYGTIESPHFENTVKLQVSHPGTAVGISMWFETLLWGDIGYSNGPGDDKAIYGMMFFPLIREVEVEHGDSVQIAVRAQDYNDDYLWQWDTLFCSTRSGEVLAAFQQSNFYGLPRAVERLRKSADKYIPNLNDDGRVARFILGLMDGSRNNSLIAAALVKQFPDKFPEEHMALTRVGEVCLQYC